MCAFFPVEGELFGTETAGKANSKSFARCLEVLLLFWTTGQDKTTAFSVSLFS